MRLQDCSREASMTACAQPIPPQPVTTTTKPHSQLSNIKPCYLSGNLVGSNSPGWSKVTGAAGLEGGVPGIRRAWSSISGPTSILSFRSASCCLQLFGHAKRLCAQVSSEQLQQAARWLLRINTGHLLRATMGLAKRSLRLPNGCGSSCRGHGTSK